MKNIASITFILISISYSLHSKASSVEDVYYQMPILICHDENYLSCRQGESIETCTKGLVKYRAPCSAGVKFDSMKNLKNSIACMVLNHAQAETIEEFESKCNGGMSINLTKAKEKVQKADPEWVLELLK